SKARDFAMPAGPSPSTATYNCFVIITKLLSCFSLGLDVSVASFDDKAEAMPFFYHVCHVVDESSGPGDLRPTGFGKHVIGTLPGPPPKVKVAFLILSSVGEFG